jgi:hypothetical protein
MKIIPILFLGAFFLGGILLIIYAPRVRDLYYRSYQQGLKRCGLVGSPYWDRYPTGPWFFRLLGAALIVMIFFGALSGFRRRDCSSISQLNPDVSCRITDSREGKTLVEYFNIDTNELKLYIRQNGHDRSIGHPDGRVKTYHDKIDENTIEFNPAR